MDTKMEKTPHYIPANTTLSLAIAQDQDGVRIDVFLTEQFPYYSRTYFQTLITEHQVKRNNTIVKKNAVLHAHDTITITFPPAYVSPIKQITHDCGVSIVYEHPHFLIINKPPHLVVHAPSHQSTEVTLVDWLVSTFHELKDVGEQDRPGIVHRLDKDTSGLLIIPRNNYAHRVFSDMFKERRIQKTYIALVKGHPEKTGVIDFPISRDPHVPTKMTHRNSNGRTALTAYTVLEYFSDACLVQAQPTTGRTHQIRVHFSALGHPLLADTLYGSPSPYLQRQALHATSLSFVFENIPFTFNQEPPTDFKHALDALRA